MDPAWAPRATSSRARLGSRVFRPRQWAPGAHRRAARRRGDTRLHAGGRWSVSGSRRQRNVSRPGYRAPRAAELAAGRCSRPILGSAAASLVPSWVDDPTVMGHVTGLVMTIDLYGNLITNIEAPLVGAFNAPGVFAGRHSFELERLRRCAPGLSCAHQFFRRDRNRPGRAKRRRWLGLKPGCARHGARRLEAVARMFRS